MVSIDTIKKMRKALNIGIIIFEYKKKDGKLRKAVGTTYNGLIPASINKNSSGNVPAKKFLSGLVNYFDLEVREWRSFYLDKLENIISINVFQKPGESSTFHFTQEDARLAAIDKELIEIETTRRMIKNALKDKLRPLNYEEAGLVHNERIIRKDLKAKVKVLTAERNEIMARKRNRL